jgi:hypothetical protein
MRRQSHNKPKLFAGEFVGGPFHGKYLEQSQICLRVPRHTSLRATIFRPGAQPQHTPTQMLGEYTWEPENGVTNFASETAIGIWQWRTLIRIPK